MWNLLIKALKRRLYDTWIDLKNSLISPTYTIGLISKRGGWGLTVVLMLLITLFSVLVSLFVVEDNEQRIFRWWPLRDSCTYLVEFWLAAFCCHAWLTTFARTKSGFGSLLRVWGLALLPLLMRLTLISLTIALFSKFHGGSTLAIFAPLSVLILSAIIWQVFVQTKCLNLIYRAPTYLCLSTTVLWLVLINLVGMKIGVPHGETFNLKHAHTYTKTETPVENYDIKASKVINTEMHSKYLEQTKNDVRLTLIEGYIRPTEVNEHTKKKASYLKLELEFPQSHTKLDEPGYFYCHCLTAKLEDELGNQYPNLNTITSTDENKLRVEHYFPTVNKDANFVYYECYFHVHELNFDIIIPDIYLTPGEEIHLGELASSDEFTIVLEAIRAEIQKDGTTKICIDNTKTGISKYPSLVSISITDADTGKMKIYALKSVERTTVKTKTETWNRHLFWYGGGTFEKTGEKVEEKDKESDGSTRNGTFEFNIGKYAGGKVTIRYASGQSRKAASEKFRLGPIPVVHHE